MYLEYLLMYYNIIIVLYTQRISFTYSSISFMFLCMAKYFAESINCCYWLKAFDGGDANLLGFSLLTRNNNPKTHDDYILGISLL